MRSSQNTSSLPALVVGMLLLGGCGIVRAEEQLQPVPLPRAAWQKDVRHFEADLRKLVSRAQVPERAVLEKRLMETETDLEVITDGSGGVVDFHAAKGTVQFVANEMVRRRPIEWEFELAQDARQIYDHSISLVPKLSTESKRDNKETNSPLLLGIRIRDCNTGPFKRGDRVKVKAYIDDFSRFRKDFSQATGLIAVYYLTDGPPVRFLVQLEKAEVAKAMPAN